VSLVSVATAVLVLGGIALAAPAAAVDDPARPDARVTHGPSCHPGGVVVEVTGGATAYAVTLATTRSPGGEDSAEVTAGETVVLRTGDVAWGETIDGRLEYAALDGSGAAFVDELPGYTFTRPAEEDCAAIAAPAAAATVPNVEPGPAGIPAVDGAPPGKAEVAGAAASVRLVETAAAPAAPPAPPSLAPPLAAALALGASGAGLAGVLGRSRRGRRHATGSA
jgi:hypothetical protein